MNKEVPLSIDIIDSNCWVSVNVEGFVEVSDGFRPSSIFVSLNSEHVNFQYSISSFHVSEERQFVPCKSKRGGIGSCVSIYVSQFCPCGLNRDIKDFDRFEEFLISKLYHRVVMPVYNEWRLVNGLEWGNGEFGRSDKYVPFCLR